MNKKTLIIIIGVLILVVIAAVILLKPPTVEEAPPPWPGMPSSDFEGTLRVFEWDGYDDPMLWDVGESAFNKIYPKVEVKFDFFVDETEALDKLKAGFPADLVHLCQSSVTRYYEEEVIEPLDVSLIPSWRQMYQEFQDLAEKKVTPVENEVYFAPLDWGYTTIVYRNDLLDELAIPEEERDTYNLLFDQRLKGKIMIMDSAEEQTPITALAAGFSPDEIWDLTDEQLEVVKNKLLEQKPLLYGYWTESEDVIAPMLAGEVVAATAWGDVYFALKEAGIDVTFSFPEENILTWICGFSIVEGLEERNPDLYAAAHAFINAWLDPQVGANLIDFHLYGHSNQAAHILAESKDIIELFRLDDPTVFKETVFWQPSASPEIEETIWNEVRWGE
ncbi:MAG TPA: extracellular solute-binding protein [Candidatus Humimicrobiaceae bacterium]|nr:extracellular solute-binding protein [Candidatus Humimicrobiaceae bacterium]